jgi:hypothetical protein
VRWDQASDTTAKQAATATPFAPFSFSFPFPTFAPFAAKTTAAAAAEKVPPPFLRLFGCGVFVGIPVVKDASSSFPLAVPAFAYTPRLAADQATTAGRKNNDNDH